MNLRVRIWSEESVSLDKQSNVRHLDFILIWFSVVSDTKRLPFAVSLVVICFIMSMRNQVDGKGLAAGGNGNVKVMGIQLGWTCERLWKCESTAVQTNRRHRRHSFWVKTIWVRSLLAYRRFYSSVFAFVLRLYHDTTWPNSLCRNKWLVQFCSNRENEHSRWFDHV